MLKASAGVENGSEDGEVIAGMYDCRAGDGIGSFANPHQREADDEDKRERTPGVTDLLRVQEGKGNAG